MLTAHFLLITTVFHLPWFETLEIPLTSFILHHIQYVKFFHSVICLASDFYSFSPPFHNLKQSISQELHFSAYNNNKKIYISLTQWSLMFLLEDNIWKEAIQLSWWLHNANRDLIFFLSLLRHSQQVVSVLLFTVWPQNECSISSTASIQSRQEEGEGQRLKD